MPSGVYLRTPAHLRAIAGNNRRHGHSTAAGGGRTPTYLSWQNMLARCLYPSVPSFPNYGGRGITVCDKWRNSFEAFLQDMGERPPGTTIDRVDSDGHYEPGNCRWATRKEQSRTARHAKLTEQTAQWIRDNPEGLSQRAIARRLGISRSLVWHVLAGRSWAE